MQKGNVGRSIRPPSQRLANMDATNDPASQATESSSQSTRRESLTQRPLSMKPLTSTGIAGPSSKPIARSTSPTKLPVGFSQRTASTKSSATINPPNVPTTQERRTNFGPPSARRPSGTASSSGLKPVLLEPGQKGVPKRNLSPMRMRSENASGPKSKAPNVSTRSSSVIAGRNSTATAGNDASTASSRPVVTPPSDRPAFNTNQQKFSPRKASAQESTEEQAPNHYAKDHLESSLELLHMHSSHRDSAKIQREWLESAKSSYEKQFNSLASLNAALNEREKDVIEQTNAAAIMAWGQTGGDTIDRKIQVLSSALSETYDITGSSGKYSIALQAFEHWYETSQYIQRRRQDKRVNRVDIIEGLGDGWKAEIATLQARVIQISNDILSLGDVQSQSDLSRCVTGLSEMLMNMLEELEMIQFIEDSIVEQEEFWVQSSIDRMASDLRSTLPS